jgi:hypothetical protein
MTKSNEARLAEQALGFVTEILMELTVDLDVGPIESSDRLGNLGLESISLVYLIAEVQQRFQLGDALVQTLRREVGAEMPQLTVAAFARIVAHTATEPYNGRQAS